jgi:hypothetical protein
MNPLTIGIVAPDGAEKTGLAAAVERHPTVQSRPITLEDKAAADIMGLVIDAPLADRQTIIVRLAGRWHVPFLVEAPAALTADGIDAMRRARGRHPVFSENRLHHHLPTRRLRERLAAAADPVEQLFAAWRFRRGAFDRGALVQLIDYLQQLVGSDVARVTTMRRDGPTAFLVSLRYENDAVGSVEIGEHLPPSSPLASELLIECFCRETVYHCDPYQQAVTVEGRMRAAVDWSEPAYECIASAFVQALTEGRGPTRSADDDLKALTLADTVLGAEAQKTSV